MAISDIEEDSEDITLEAKIKEIPQARAISTKYGQKKVSTVTIEDDTGEIRVTLWEEQLEKVSEGDDIKIEGAYARNWGEELQINIPREGSIEPL